MTRRQAVTRTGMPERGPAGLRRAIQAGRGSPGGRGGARRVLRPFAATLPVLGLLAAAPASAVDGVIEINHERAEAGGITPGDAPGYPVTLSQPGSFVLTGDLSPRSSSGIEITASRVSLDLNGFRVRCFVVAFPPPPDPCGGADGISVAGSDVAVRDGVVSGFGGNGISGGGNLVVEAVRVVDNTGDGVLLGGGEVRRATIARNGGDGVQRLSGRASVVESTVADNGGIGIRDVDLVRDNRVEGNASSGIVVGPGALVEGNTVIGNAGAGIYASSDALILGNTAVGNAGAGIEVGSGCLVADNVAGQNASWGLRILTNRAGFARNVLHDNDGAGGTPDFSGFDTGLGRNLCTSGLCP